MTFTQHMHRSPHSDLAGSMTPSAETGPESPELKDAIAHGYEPHDIGLRGVFFFLIGLVVTVIISLLLVYGIMNLFVEYDRHSDPVASPVVIEHGPIPYPLQPSYNHDVVDRQEMAAMRKNTQKILSSSGTLGDRRFIPIDQAIDQVLPLLPIKPTGATPQ